MAVDEFVPSATDLYSQWCTFSESLWVNLHAGTKCLFSWQCMTGLHCTEGFCRGLAEGELCFHDHSCDKGLHCRMEELGPR